MATGPENFYEEWAQECTSQWELNRRVLETIRKRKAELKSAQEDHGSNSFFCFLRRFFLFHLSDSLDRTQMLQKVLYMRWPNLLNLL